MAFPTFTESRGPQNIDPATKSAFTIPVVYCTVGSCGEFREKGYTNVTVNSATDCKVEQQFSVSLTYSGLADAAVADYTAAIDYLKAQLLAALAANSCGADPG